jgi:hypothetical protein
METIADPGWCAPAHYVLDVERTGTWRNRYLLVPPLPELEVRRPHFRRYTGGPIWREAIRYGCHDTGTLRLPYLEPGRYRVSKTFFRRGQEFVARAFFEVSR